MKKPAKTKPATPSKEEDEITPERREQLRRAAAKWRAQNPEHEQQRKRDWYLRRRAAEMARSQVERSSEDTADKPPTPRRYRILKERVYFNSRLGFSADELTVVLRELFQVQQEAKKRADAEKARAEEQAKQEKAAAASKRYKRPHW